MVGNDVVDLDDDEVRADTLHPRFDERVFGRSERELLGASVVPNRTRWILWAAKEAAFKLMKKLDPCVVFAPSRFVVNLDSTLNGRVKSNGHSVLVSIRVNEKWIHAIATDDDPARQRVLSALEMTHTASDPSVSVRELAIRTLSERLKKAPDHFSIRQRGRIPYVMTRGENTALDLSLSHHGRFVGFACDPG